MAVGSSLETVDNISTEDAINVHSLIQSGIVGNSTLVTYLHGISETKTPLDRVAPEFYKILTLNVGKVIPNRTSGFMDSVLSTMDAGDVPKEIQEIIDGEPSDKPKLKVC